MVHRYNHHDHHICHILLGSSLSQSSTNPMQMKKHIDRHFGHPDKRCLARCLYNSELEFARHCHRNYRTGRAHRYNLYFDTAGILPLSVTQMCPLDMLLSELSGDLVCYRWSLASIQNHPAHHKFRKLPDTRPARDSIHLCLTCLNTSHLQLHCHIDHRTTNQHSL